MVGQGHLRGFLHEADAQVVAVCDVDRWRRENAQATTEQAYADRRTSGTYRGCAAYNDLRDLLARDDIDAVFIGTGDRWHGVATVMAAKAGKDVYVEKPISLTIAEARAMVEAVRRYGRVCQCGLQQRSTREFRLACQLVRDGALGKIQAVYVIGPGTSAEVNLPAEPVPDSLDWDLWLGPAPWRPFNHRFVYLGQPLNVVPWDFCRDFGGGCLTSGTVHAFDVVQWGLGMDHAGPIEVIPPGSRNLPRPDLQVPRRRARAGRAGPVGPQRSSRSPRAGTRARRFRSSARCSWASGAGFTWAAKATSSRSPPTSSRTTRPSYEPADRGGKPPPQLVRGDPHPRPPGLRRGGGLPVDDRLPLGLHRLLDRPGLEVGPGRRAVPGRRRSQPPAVAGDARTVARVSPPGRLPGRPCRRETRGTERNRLGPWRSLPGTMFRQHGLVRKASGRCPAA